jgi:uncharacterized alpha/beta hydrolase family protein
MTKKNASIVIAILFISAFILVINSASAQKMPGNTMTLRLEKAKMAPVTFSHGAHGKTISCSICHHKDNDPTKPEKCGTCHLVKDVKEKAPPAQDAFHGKCQACHKENDAKGVRAPTRCNDCHKK